MGGRAGNGNMEEYVNVKSEVISINDREQEEPLINIKSEDDINLFEQEESGDDGNADGYMTDFLMPDIQLGEESERVHKRKQDFNFQTKDYLEELQLIEEAEADYRREAGNEESSSSQRSNDVFSPLYKLNPDDFADDPVRQTQIKKARITYRHHELKKWTIVTQRREINQLRRHVNALTAKVMELQGCGCEKNGQVNIDVVDTKIPHSNIEKVFPHIKWRQLEKVLDTLSQFPDSPPKKEVTTPEKTEPVKKSKPIMPLVNIHSSRLGNLTLNTMETPAKMTPTPSTSPALRKYQSAKATSFVKKTPPSSPVNRITTFGDHVVNVELGSSMSPKKYNNKSPATAVPASRLVFEKKVNTLNVNPSPSQLQTPPLGPSSSLRFLNSAKAHSIVANTDSVGRWIIVPNYQPILPKSEPDAVSQLDSLDEEIRKREVQKLALEQNFKALDGDDEEDEVAILATFSPQQRKRKQAMNQNQMYRKKEKDDEYEVLDVDAIKKELEERYSDVVFEEAD